MSVNSGLSIHDLVPEYRSRNPLVRWIFFKRFDLALSLAQLDTANPLQLLDLGCGEGQFIRRLQKSYPQHRVTGMDIHPQITNLNIPGAFLHQTDITAPNALPAQAYDRIFCFEVLEHIPQLEIPLQSIRNALKPNGLLLVSAPTENIFYKTCRFILKGTFSEKEGPGAGPHYRDARVLRNNISEQGFQIIHGADIPLPGPFSLAQFSVFRKK